MGCLNRVPSLCTGPWYAGMPAHFIIAVPCTLNADICNIYMLIIRILIIKQPKASTSGIVLRRNLKYKLKETSTGGARTSTYTRAHTHLLLTPVAPDPRTPKELPIGMNFLELCV